MRQISSPAALVSEAVDKVFSRDRAGILPSATVAQLRAGTGYSEDQLMLAMLPHAKQAAVPQMSGYQVGAAALGSSGCLYLGFNLELRGRLFQHTVHAEQSAIYLAADAGEDRLTKLATSATPCGHCRQFMQELPFPEDLQIICPEQETKSLKELLPLPFGPQHLELQGHLLQPPHHDLKIWASSSETDDWGLGDDVGLSQLADAALIAARRSYAPFGAPSGMAVRVGSENRDQIISGFAVQSVAHNPGMTTAGPLQGMLVKLTASGYDWNSISEAVLVETVTDQGYPVHDYEHHVQHVLKVLAPNVFGQDGRPRLHVILVTTK